jgi:hypothetical protein
MELKPNNKEINLDDKDFPHRTQAQNTGTSYNPDNADPPQPRDVIHHTTISTNNDPNPLTTQNDHTHDATTYNIVDRPDLALHLHI